MHHARGDRELWCYLWPSLVGLAVGLAFSIVIGVATGLLLARVRPLDLALDVYITFLYSIFHTDRCCSERQIWTNILLSAALPFSVTGIRLAVGRGLISMVLADL